MPSNYCSLETGAAKIRLWFAGVLKLLDLVIKGFNQYELLVIDLDLFFYESILKSVQRKTLEVYVEIRTNRKDKILLKHSSTMQIWASYKTRHMESAEACFVMA